jgi:two-component system KDP operon response regulator KdpE
MSAPRVALVEDEPTIREAVGLAFRREGFNVLEFGDGLSAWEALEPVPPDVAVLYIGLPRMAASSCAAGCGRGRSSCPSSS